MFFNSFNFFFFFSSRRRHTRYIGDWSSDVCSSDLGPWNYEEFRDFCERYYRDVIGSSGMGRAIHRGERNLIERIAIRLNRREEINLPSSAEKMMHANAGEQKDSLR